MQIFVLYDPHVFHYIRVELMVMETTIKLQVIWVTLNIDVVQLLIILNFRLRL